MALNDILFIQNMEMDKKDLSYDIKAKELEAYWINKYEKLPTNTHYKFYDD